MMENNNELSKKALEILRGLEISYQKLLAFKKYKKTPLIVSQNGIVVEINPENGEVINKSEIINS